MSLVHHIALMLLAVIFKFLWHQHFVRLKEETQDTVVYESGRNVSLPGRN